MQNKNTKPLLSEPEQQTLNCIVFDHLKILPLTISVLDTSICYANAYQAEL